MKERRFLFFVFPPRLIFSPFLRKKKRDALGKILKMLYKSFIDLDAFLIGNEILPCKFINSTGKMTKRDLVDLGYLIRKEREREIIHYFI